MTAMTASPWAGISASQMAQAILEDVVHEHETELEAFMAIEVKKDRHGLKILKDGCGFELSANDEGIFLQLLQKRWLHIH